MTKAKVKVEPLSVDSWRRAALRALADKGVNAVAIEPLAKQLGVTKGSGYWHFESRDALLKAALEEWEIKTTQLVIERLSHIPSPRERLTTLFRQAFSGTLDARVYFALASADQHPAVATTLRRVSQQRLAFLADCYRQLGHAESEAQHRAVTAYAVYLGVLMLRRHATDVIAARERDRFLEHLLATVV